MSDGTLITLSTNENGEKSIQYQGYKYHNGEECVFEKYDTMITTLDHALTVGIDNFEVINYDFVRQYHYVNSEVREVMREICNERGHKEIKLEDITMDTPDGNYLIVNGN